MKADILVSSQWVVLYLYDWLVRLFIARFVGLHLPKIGRTVWQKKLFQDEAISFYGFNAADCVSALKVLT